MAQKDNSTTTENDRHGIKDGFSSFLPFALLFLALLGSLFLCFHLWRKNMVLEKERLSLRESLSQIANRLNINYAKKPLKELANAVNVAFSNTVKENKALEEKIKELEESINGLVDAERSEKKYRTNPDSHFTNNSGSRGYNDDKYYEIRDGGTLSPTVKWDIQKENEES